MERVECEDGKWKKNKVIGKGETGKKKKSTKR
jgi:hypothetical protein